MPFLSTREGYCSDPPLEETKTFLITGCLKGLGGGPQALADPAASSNCPRSLHACQVPAQLGSPGKQGLG